jgi:tetratricopeptide (TPR) repeat protein
MLCEALMPLHPAPSAANRTINATRNDCHFSFTRVTIWANDMIATINSEPRAAGVGWLRRARAITLLTLINTGLLTSFQASAQTPAPSTPARSYTTAREVWQKNPADRDAAWQFARACFDLAEVDEDNRAKIAEEAIGACQAALLRNTNVGNYYYMALNFGQLARTKKLGALRLVSDMESVLRKAIELDPKFDFAGPHRTLGMLYRDAPGWPASIGNRSKAKQQLLKAVELAPDYPDNQISLIESLLQWGELRNARTAVSDAEPYLRQARLKLMGERWRQTWRDWDERWEKIRRKTEPNLTSPRDSR